MIDFVDYLERQRDWSIQTFGESKRTNGVTKHIEKELDEIRENPNDLMEWIDVIILAMDGAWRAGYEPQEIIDALVLKQKINFARNWPPVGTFDDDEPSEHIETIE